MADGPGGRHERKARERRGRERGARRARLALATYRGVGRGAALLLPLWLARRARRGKEVRARLGERLGRAGMPRPDGPLVWLHAASVGELNSVLPLAHRLRALGLEMLVTTGTVTSAAIAARELPHGAIHQFQALDVVPAVERFLDHWRPDLAIFVESELWPVTLHALRARNVQQIMVNARMSDRSFARWAKRPVLARGVFGTLGQVSAQSEADAACYHALGSPRVATTGNLKADTTPPPHDEAELERLRAALGDRPVWTAASLHPGEDAVVADAAVLLRKRRADALAIVAPRHPERGDAMRATFEARGLTVAQRSRGEAVENTDVLLADTLGEMGLWYRLAPIAFMGRSLGDTTGGQNPIEPVLCGAAVLSGRSVANFREAYRLLLLEGGARFVDDAPMLADFVAHLWDRPDKRETMREGGERTIATMAGGLERTLAALEPWLAPLRMQAMLERTRAVADAQMVGLSEARLRAMHKAAVEPPALRRLAQAGE